MKILITPRSCKNYIVTIAIGDKYLNDWKKYAYQGWKRYCDTNDIGLIVFDENLIEKEHPNWKKATWQKMLIAEYLSGKNIEIENICYLDSDILINPYAPNVFRNYDEKKIGLTSLRNNLPYPHQECLKRLAFLRHNFYSADYPLDSALFMSLQQLYEHHNLTPQADEACMGFIVFNAENHGRLMSEWFHKYDKMVESITEGGDQTHVNYEIQNWGNVQWFDYRFQAIWPLQMAWNYPFLYESSVGNKLTRECVEATLMSNYFLHFAGVWHESEMWKIDGILTDESKLDFIKRYRDYVDLPASGIPTGFVRPNKAG